MARIALLLLIVQQAVLKLPVLPELWLLWLAMPFALACLGYKSLRVLGVFVLVLIMELSSASSLVSPIALTHSLHSPARVEAKVISLVEQTDEGAAYDISIRKAEKSELVGVRFTAYQATERADEIPSPGSTIYGLLIPQPLHGTTNLAAGYSDRVAVFEGFDGRAKIKHLVHEDPETRGWLPLQIRHQIAIFVASAVPQEFAQVLSAVTIGSTLRLEQDKYRLLSATGTQHLLVISGLHLSLIGWGVFKLLRLIGCRLGVCTVLACLAACAYFLISGQALSAQRATLMFLVLLLGQAGRFNLGRFSGYWIAWIVSLTLTPFASALPGFWYSFGAVLVLLLSHRGFQQSVWKDFPRVLLSLRVQIALLLGLLPVSSMLLNSSALAAPIANLVAIPIMSFLILPATLLAELSFLLNLALGHSALIEMADITLKLAVVGLKGLWWWLECVSEFLPTFQAAKLPVGYAGLSLLMVLLMLSGARIISPGLLCVVLMPFIHPKLARPPWGSLNLLVMDVGQGTSVLIQSANEDWLYDAGGLTRFGFNAGERIVIPELRAMGIATLDKLIVSHNDADHAGGAPIIKRKLKVVSTIEPSKKNCIAQPAWVVDGVKFQMFTWQQGKNTNDQSCVLQIKGLGFKVLLPGDIESGAELALLPSLDRHIDWLLMPHHGAKTSSTPGFLNHVMASTVVASAGFANSYDHPHPIITARYQNRGSAVVTTIEHGALFFRADRAGVQLLMSARKRYKTFWGP